MRREECNSSPRIVVVGKNADFHRNVHQILGSEYDVHHAYFERVALLLLKKRQFAAAILYMDQHGSYSGRRLLKAIELFPIRIRVPVIGILPSGLTLGDEQVPGRTTLVQLHEPLAEETLIEAINQLLLAKKRLAQGSGRGPALPRSVV